MQPLHRCTLVVLALLSCTQATDSSRAESQLDLGFRDDPTWLWQRVSAAVLNPGGASRHTGAVELNAFANIPEGDGVAVGTRGNRVIRAMRPHPTAPLLVLRQLLTGAECDSLIRAAELEVVGKQQPPAWCLSASVHTTLARAGMSSSLNSATPSARVGDLDCHASDEVHRDATARLGEAPTCVLASDGLNTGSDRVSGWLSHALGLSGFHAGPSQVWMENHDGTGDVETTLTTSCHSIHGGNPDSPTAVVFQLFLARPSAPSPATLSFPHLGIEIPAARGTAVIWSTLRVPDWDTPSVSLTSPVAMGACDPAMATRTVEATPFPIPQPHHRGSVAPSRVLRRDYSAHPQFDIASPLAEGVMCSSATTCVELVLQRNERKSQKLARAAEEEFEKQRHHNEHHSKEARGADPDAQEEERVVWDDASMKDMHALLQKYVAAYSAAPGSVRAASLVAYQLARTGRLNQSHALWTHVVERLPHCVRARTSLASVDIAQGQLDEAMAHLDQALHLAPDNVDVIMQQAYVLESQGRLRAAMSKVHDAAALAADFPQAMGRIRHEGRRLAQKAGIDSGHVFRTVDPTGIAVSEVRRRSSANKKETTS